MIKLFFWFIGVLAGIGGGVYVFFFSGLLTIRHIAVFGVSSRVAEQVEAEFRTRMGGRRYHYLANDSYFLVSANALQTAIHADHVEISSITVKKKFPDRLQIDIRERTYAGIWCGIAQQSAINNKQSAEDCYLIDSEGVLYEEAASVSGALVLVLKDRRRLTLGERAMEGNLIANLTDMQNDLRDRFNVVAREFYVQDLPDVTAHMSEGWKLLFDGSRPTSDTLTALQKTLHTIEAAQKKIAYIDLRISGRAYFALEERNVVTK